MRTRFYIFCSKKDVPLGGESPTNSRVVDKRLASAYTRIIDLCTGCRQIRLSRGKSPETPDPERNARIRTMGLVCTHRGHHYRLYLYVIYCFVRADFFLACYIYWYSTLQCSMSLIYFTEHRGNADYKKVHSAHCITNGAFPRMKSRALEVNKKYISRCVSYTNHSIYI
jgi:hypothetical protein